MKVSKTVEESIREKVEYPADKLAIVEKLGDAPELTEDERQWLHRLPEKSYTSADEVISALSRLGQQKGGPQEMPSGAPAAA